MKTILKIIIIFIAMYAILWVGVAPSLGTIRCSHWVKQDTDMKCDRLVPGFININHKFEYKE